MDGDCLDIAAIRQDFPIFNNLSEKPLIYLDNAATTQRPAVVIDAVSRFYRETNANVHRGIYALSEAATAAYEEARSLVAEFIQADRREIVFTRGTTESINLLAYAWVRRRLRPGDEIVVTEMEHHSNLVPWQLAAKDTGARLHFVPVTAQGTLDLEAFAELLNEHTRLVAVTHQSNVLGTINPVREICRMAHEVGALVLVDAAQSVPHFPVNVKDLDCDFLAFSGHKMLGPTGIGVLFGRRELLEEMEPFMAGGEMISQVTREGATWNEVPYKFEAGTMPIAQAVGMGAAIKYLKQVGWETIEKHEQELTAYALKRLSELEGVKLYGPRNNRGPVFSFSVSEVHPHDMAHFLDEAGIAVRAGHHCAQPLLASLGEEALTRASLYFYNTREEIDVLCEVIERTRRFFAP